MSVIGYVKVQIVRVLILDVPTTFKGGMVWSQMQINIDVQWALCSHMHSFKIGKVRERMGDRNIRNII